MTNDDYLTELDLMIDMETVDVSEGGVPNEYLSFLLAAKGRNNTLRAAALLIRRLAVKLPRGDPLRETAIEFINSHGLVALLLER